MITFSKKSITHTLLFICLLSLFLAFSLECTLFNYRFYQSMFYEPQNVMDTYDVDYSEKLIKTSDTVYSIEEPSLEEPSLEEASAEILISNINTTVKNIYIDITPLPPVSETDTAYAANYLKWQGSTIVILASDEAQGQPAPLPSRNIIGQVEATKYITLNQSGETRTLIIRIQNKEGQEIAIPAIQFNKPVPFRFSATRVLLVFLTLSLCAIIRPKSPFYACLTHLKSPAQRLVVIAMVIILITGAVIVPAFIAAQNPLLSSHSQYSSFSAMLAKGQIHYDYEPSEELSALDNPYDPTNRQDAPLYWDHAYYDGKYYMYFGIGPELLLYFPYFILSFGRLLPNYAALSVILICLITGVPALLNALIRTYFPKTPFLIYLMMSLATITGSAAAFVKYPSVYTVPIASAVALGLWGLYFWITAMTADGFKRSRLTIGALLMAMIFACRPQIGVVFLLGAALFWHKTTRERVLFSRKNLTDTCCLLAPFILIALGLMWYNAARFGSPFDFGANYNLTTNDMTRRGFKLDRIPLGIFTNFLQPPQIIAQFPFVTPVTMQTAYQGTTISEAILGGAFLSYPLLLFSLFFYTLKKKLQEKRLWGFTVLLLVLPVIISIVDTEMAGILQRYMNDYLWLLFLAACIVVFAYASENRGNIWLRRITSVLFAVTLLYTSCTFFAQEPSSIDMQNSMSVFFYQAASIIEFWQ